jgi:hypothetical protein
MTVQKCAGTLAIHPATPATAIDSVKPPGSWLLAPPFCRAGFGIQTKVDAMKYVTYM